MEQLGRSLVVLGVVLAAIGGVLAFGPRLPFRLGRLPLDIHIQRENFSFYFPLGTCVLLSIVLTLAARVLGKR